MNRINFVGILVISDALIYQTMYWQCIAFLLEPFFHFKTDTVCPHRVCGCGCSVSFRWLSWLSSAFLLSWHLPLPDPGGDACMCVSYQIIIENPTCQILLWLLTWRQQSCSWKTFTIRSDVSDSIAAIALDCFCLWKFPAALHAVGAKCCHLPAETLVQS